MPAPEGKASRPPYWSVASFAGHCAPTWSACRSLRSRQQLDASSRSSCAGLDPGAPPPPMPRRAALVHPAARVSAECAGADTSRVRRGVPGHPPGPPPAAGATALDLYRWVLDRHVLPYFGDRELATLTPPEVRRWHARLSGPDGPGSNTAAKAYTGCSPRSAPPRSPTPCWPARRAPCAAAGSSTEPRPTLSGPRTAPRPESAAVRSRFPRCCCPNSTPPCPLCRGGTGRAGVRRGLRDLVGHATSIAALAAACDVRLLAVRTLLEQLVFAILSGHGDAHAKNFSVLQQPDGEWRVSPAAARHPSARRSNALPR